VHFGFSGNVTASSDKSDQKLSGNDFIKSFSLHQLKKADFTRYPAILQRLESCGVMVVLKICWLILLYMLLGQLIRC
jgi:hypothetical protein